MPIIHRQLENRFPRITVHALEGDPSSHTHTHTHTPMSAISDLG